MKIKAVAVAVSAVLVAVSGLAPAHHGRLRDHLLRGTILGFGIYTTASEAFLKRTAHAPGTPAGAELVERTLIVPALAGTRFGFCVSVTGALADGDLDLVKVVSHPPLFNADGSVSTGYEQEIELTATAGEALACIGHTIENSDEALPGRWTVALMAADQVVAAKTFELR